MIKLEEGKYYATRDGRRAYVSERDSRFDGPFIGSIEGTPGCYNWHEDGLFTRTNDSPADLIGEWVSRPIATPTSDIKTELANEAVRIVTGARRGAYGTPENNFERIARFWTAYFQNTGRDIEVSAMDVSPMMRLMKEARLCETPDHRDSHVDLIGYTLTGAEVNGLKPVDSASDV